MTDKMKFWKRLPNVGKILVSLEYEKDTSNQAQICISRRF